MSKFCRAEPHPAFEHPPPTAKVWRYLGLAQLLSTMQNGALHFTRVDRFQDPFEGALPKPMLDADREMYAQLGIRGPRYTRERHRAGLSWYAACCWYVDDHESEAMWNLYAAQGIALQTTFDRLDRIFPERKAGEPAQSVYVGMVNYVDYDIDALKPIVRDGQPMWNNSFIPVMHKRKSFQHERELRAVITRLDLGEDAFDHLADGTTSRRSGISEQGEYVPVDLHALVEKVYVSPRMPAWFRDVVVSSVQRFGYAFDVEQSALAALPDYDQP